MPIPQAPGEIVLAELKAQGYTQADAATLMGRSAQYVNDIVKGKKRIDPLVAMELHDVLDSKTAEEWLNLELKYQQAQLGNQQGKLKRKDVMESFPFALEAVKQGWIADSNVPATLESNIQAFLARRDPNLRAHNRTGNSELLNVSLQAWHIRVMDEVAADQRQIGKFDLAKEGALLRELKSCMRVEDDVRKVGDILRRYGIRFVIVPSLKKAPVDGVASYNGGKPYIALSLRNAQLDRFWFTLMHECAHVLFRHSDKTSIELDNVDQRGEKDKFEKQADDFAKNQLLDEQAYNKFALSSSLLLAEIEAFAASQGVHRSIVIGRLKSEGWLTWVDFAREHPSVRDNLAATGN